MEFFNKAKAVRLKSHLNKYLVAEDDEQTVRQSHHGSSRNARWKVEAVEGNPHAIRLQSCYDGYLAASDEPFLLGVTGKKVIQRAAHTKLKDAAIEWEPIKEGYKVKLRSKGGKFLRANGATPPWRNSITHDLPYRTVTQDWVMWDVEVVDISAVDDDDEYLTSDRSSFSSTRDDYLCPSTPSVKARSRAGSAVNDGCLTTLPHRSGRQNGMEFFNGAKAVRLQSHHGKYLIADEDEETVRQSRDGASRSARWTVEFVDGKRNRIRLKSCHGLYLTAAEQPFLLGMTGRKVLQTLPEMKTDVAIEWEPVKEGLNVKLMTSNGKFLRANGGAPPWRNSVTHDVPHRTATQDWVLWGVDVVDLSMPDPDFSSDRLSRDPSFSSLTDDYPGSSDTGSPVVQHCFRSGYDSLHSYGSGNASMDQVSGMDFFKKAKSVRLKSHHDKYLTADSDEETVFQDRQGSSKSVKWAVEFVEGVENVVRLKSCYGKYLKASDEEFLLGVTGRKVEQALPRRLDSSVEWEPIRDGMQVKLKTRYGNFLRANGGLPPWRNSITHDIPHRHHDWILWEVDVVEIRPESPPKVIRSESFEEDLSSSSIHIRSPNNACSGSFEDSARKSEGRLIYYYVADDDGNVNDAIEGPSFQFKGHGLEELIQKLEEETGLVDFILCSRNRVNGKLYPLRLALPPNNATMHVVIVPSTSKVANHFMPAPPAAT